MSNIASDDSAIAALKAKVRNAEARDEDGVEAVESARTAPADAQALPDSFGPGCVQGPGWRDTDRFVDRRR